MSRKIKRPSVLRRGRSTHRRRYFAGSPVCERVYFNRRGEQNATHHSSPTPFSGARSVSKGAYFQGAKA